MPIFPLSFAEVTVYLGSTHLIEISRTPALQSRIKDFQRRGFPSGLNSGKGKAAQYGVEQVVLLAIAFEFLELGMAPKEICALLRAASDALIHEVRQIYKGGSIMFRKVKRLVYFDPRGLSDLREGKDFADGASGISIGTIRDLTKSLTQTNSRLAVIDLQTLVIDLAAYLGAATAKPDEDVVNELVAWSFGK